MLARLTTETELVAHEGKELGEELQVSDWRPRIGPTSVFLPSPQPVLRLRLLVLMTLIVDFYTRTPLTKL